MREREIALKPRYKCGLKGKRGQSHRPLVATSISPTPQPLPPNTSHASCVIIILMKRTHGQMACSCFCQYSRHINLKFALFEADSLWIRRGINDQSLISMINTCRSGSKTSFSCYVSVRGQLIARKWRWKWTSHSLSYSRFRRLSSPRASFNILLATWTNPGAEHVRVPACFIIIEYVCSQARAWIMAFMLRR